MTFYHINLQFCGIFSLCGDFLSPKFTYLWHFYTSLWPLPHKFTFLSLIFLVKFFFESFIWMFKGWWNTIPWEHPVIYHYRKNFLPILSARLYQWRGIEKPFGKMQVKRGAKNQAPRDWRQEGAWQNQIYKNRIPATFSFWHLCGFRKRST